MTIERVMARLDRIADRAGVEAPPVQVADILQARGTRHIMQGTAAMTDLSARGSGIIVLKGAANELSNRAIDFVLAHELHHVLRAGHTRGRITSRLMDLLCYGPAAAVAILAIAAWTLMVTDAGVQVVTAVMTTSAAALTLIAGHVVRLALDRLGESRADTYASHLVADAAAGYVEVRAWIRGHSSGPPSDDPADFFSWCNYWIGATHPRPSARIRKMERIADRQGRLGKGPPR